MKGTRAENAWGTRIESGGEDPRQDLTFGYWHFHPGVDGEQPFGVARAQSLHCLRPARSFYARVNASLWGPGRANRPPGGLGAEGKEREGKGDTTESGRVGFYSPRARHIVYPKNTLRAHAIAWHAALSNGERVSLADLADVARARPIDIRDRDRGSMSTSSVSMNVRMDNA